MNASLWVSLLFLLAVFMLLVLILKTRAENARAYRDFDERIDRQGSSMLTLTSLRETLEALSRNAEARTKLVGCALADRIDALSARMDAVELACGIREKAKTMGGRSD